MIKQSSDVSDALDAFCRSDFLKATALLQGSRERGAAALRARLAVRLGRPDACIAEYERACQYVTDTRELAEVTLAYAVGLENRNEKAAAELALARAADLGREADDPVFLAHHCIVTGMVLGSRESEPDSGYIGRALDIIDEAPRKTPDAAFLLEENHVRGQVLLLQALYAAVNEDWPHSLTLLHQSLLTMRLVKRRDIHLEASVTYDLAWLSRLNPTKTSRELLCLWVSEIQWLAGLDICRAGLKRAFQVQEYLYGYEMPSEIFGSRGFAVVDERLGFACDRIFYDKWNTVDEREQCVSEIQEMLALSREWFIETFSHHDLFSAAAIIATIDANRALELLDGRIGDLSVDRTAFFFERHFYRHFRDLTLGIAAKTEGSITLARYHLENALANRHQSLGEPWAAIIGIELFTLSRDALHLAAAEHFVETWPETKFSQRLLEALSAALSAGPYDFPYLRPGG